MAEGNHDGDGDCGVGDGGDPIGGRGGGRGGGGGRYPHSQYSKYSKSYKLQ